MFLVFLLKIFPICFPLVLNDISLATFCEDWKPYQKLMIYNSYIEFLKRITLRFEINIKIKQKRQS